METCNHWIIYEHYRKIILFNAFLSDVTYRNNEYQTYCGLKSLNETDYNVKFFIMLNHQLYFILSLITIQITGFSKKFHQLTLFVYCSF